MNPHNPIQTQLAAVEIACVASAVYNVLAAAYTTDFALRQPCRAAAKSFLRAQPNDARLMSGRCDSGVLLDCC